MKQFSVLLHMRQIHNKCITFYKELTDVNDEFNNIFSENIDLEEFAELKENLNIVQGTMEVDLRIQISKDCITMINEKLQKYCPHEFEDDYVDHDIEHMKKIVYCKICEYTKTEQDK